MEYLRYGFDLDDCVVDFNSTLTHIAREHFGVEIPKNSIHGFKIEEYTDFTKENIGEVIGMTIRAVDLLQPMRGAITFIKRYHELTGHHIIFITARHEREATIEWLHKWIHPIPWECVFINKTGGNKASVVIEKDIDVYIEDRVKYAQQIADAKRHVILVDHAHNQHANDNHPYITRVSDWDEITAIYKHANSLESLKKYELLFRRFDNGVES